MGSFVRALEWVLYKYSQISHFALVLTRKEKTKTKAMKKKVKLKRNYTSPCEFGDLKLRYFSFSYEQSNSWLLVITRRNCEETARNT